MNDESPASGSGRGISGELIAGGILAAAVLLLVFQNTTKTRIEWLFFEWRAQLWMLLLVTAVVGIVAAELLGRAIRRRRRKR